MNSRTWILASAISPVLLSIQTEAIAQEPQATAKAPEAQPAAATPATTADTADHGEIIVTAQKRPERLIATPQSVSVLTSADLAKLGATQLRDYANVIPGLSLSTGGAGYNQISLRGVTAGFDVSSTVGIYVDEVPYGTSSAFARGDRFTLDSDLTDVQRIEVLKGPQGTLYGASAMGGLLKYVTKLPDPTNLTADIETGLWATEHGGIGYQGAAALNLPVDSDRAALRISGFETHDGGYIDNLALGKKDVNRSDIYGGRADLLLKPAPGLTVRITGFAQNTSRDGMGTTDVSADGNPLFGNSLDQYRPYAEPFRQHFRLISGTVNYDFGKGISLTSVSSYQSVKTRLVYDLSNTYVPLLSFYGLGNYSAVAEPETASVKKFTQEVRLASSGGKLIDWTLGGFYTNENNLRDASFALRDLAGQPAPNDLFLVSAPSHYKEIAGFGDVTLHLAPRFDVTGGLRYSSDRQSYSQTGSGIFVQSYPTNHSHEHVVNYLANARYELSDHATAYLRYATGYRPGGPNFVLFDPNTGQPLAAPTFQSDRRKSYEAGFKAETLDRRLGFDAAIFYIDWTNMQIFDLSSPFGGYTNAPGATVRGAELSLTVHPLRGLVASGAVAYQDAHMSQADANLGAVKGERMPNVPRFTAALNADYSFSSSRLAPRIGATFRYVSRRTASFNESLLYPQYRLPAYATLDLRAGLTSGRIDWQLYVRNLFDRRGQLSALLYNGIQPAILQPRTIGLSASTHF